MAVQARLEAHRPRLSLARPIPQTGLIGRHNPPAELDMTVVAIERMEALMGGREITGLIPRRGSIVDALSADPPASPGDRTYRTGPQEPLADIAARYLGARETGNNRMGRDRRMREIFEADSAWTDGTTDGYPWCASFVSLCTQHLIRESEHYQGVRPPRTAGVTAFRSIWAPAQNCAVFMDGDTRYQAHRGDVVVFTFSHIGIVTSTEFGGIRTIEGNTNAAGSREGTVVRRKFRTFDLVRCYVRLPVTS